MQRMHITLMSLPLILALSACQSTGPHKALKMPKAVKIKSFSIQEADNFSSIQCPGGESRPMFFSHNAKGALKNKLISSLQNTNYEIPVNLNININDINHNRFLGRWTLKSQVSINAGPINTIAIRSGYAFSFDKWSACRNTQLGFQHLTEQFAQAVRKQISRFEFATKLSKKTA